MMNEQVSLIMSTNLITIGPEDNLDTARKIFLKHRIHHLPVVSGSKLVGLLTTSDMWNLNEKFEDYSAISVKKAMTTKLAKLEASSKIGTAAEVFLENLFHALPIVDDQDNLIGIVTTFDVLKYEYKKEYPKQFPFIAPRS
jgi:CBS domain-containing protein